MILMIKTVQGGFEFRDISPEQQQDKVQTLAVVVADDFC